MDDVQQDAGEVEADASPPRAVSGQPAAGGLAIKRLAAPHDVELVDGRENRGCKVV